MYGTVLYSTICYIGYGYRNSETTKNVQYRTLQYFTVRVLVLVLARVTGGHAHHHVVATVALSYRTVALIKPATIFTTVLITFFSHAFWYGTAPPWYEYSYLLVPLNVLGFRVYTTLYTTLLLRVRYRP